MFGQYGMKVSFWGAENLILGIYIENHPQRPILRLSENHPLVE